MDDKRNPSTLVKIVSDAAELVKSYGVFNILKAIGITVLIYAVFSFLYNPNKYFDMYDRYTIQKHNDAIEYRLEVDPKITEIIKELKYTTQAARVFVLEAHNGSANLNGLPFLYLDMRYEDCAQDVEYISDDYKNLDVSRFPFIHLVHNKTEWFGSVDSVEVIDKKLSYRLRSNDVVYIAIVSMHGLDAPLGFVGLTYTKEDKIIDRLKLDRELYFASQKISTLLDGYNKK